MIQNTSFKIVNLNMNQTLHLLPRGGLLTSETSLWRAWSKSCTIPPRKLIISGTRIRRPLLTCTFLTTTYNFILIMFHEKINCRVLIDQNVDFSVCLELSNCMIEVPLKSIAENGENWSFTKSTSKWAKLLNDCTESRMIMLNKVQSCTIKNL